MTPSSTLLTAALLLGLVLPAAGCTRKAAAPAVPPPAQAPAALLNRVKVLDADVLVVDGRHVRLAGFDTPKPIPQARCWAEAAAAKQAARVVAQMVRDAGRIDLVPTGAQDEYTRTVSAISLDGLDLGQALYDQGLAAKGDGFSWCGPLRQGGAQAPRLSALMNPVR